MLVRIGLAQCLSAWGVHSTNLDAGPLADGASLWVSGFLCQALLGAIAKEIVTGNKSEKQKKDMFSVDLLFCGNSW